MSNPYLHIPYLASMIVCCVLAFVFRVSLRTRYLSIMIPFMTWVCAQEILLVAFYFNNAWVYNIYRPLTTIVFFVIYYQVPLMKPWRRTMIIVLSAYMSAVLIDYVFVESIRSPGSYMTLARTFVITLFAILFLFRYFNLENSSEEKFWRPLLWITAGVVTFYPVISISLTFQKFLDPASAVIYHQRIYQLIPQAMSIVMYSCFSYSFYLCRKIR